MSQPERVENRRSPFSCARPKRHSFLHSPRHPVPRQIRADFSPFVPILRLFFPQTSGLPGEVKELVFFFLLLWRNTREVHIFPPPFRRQTSSSPLPPTLSLVELAGCAQSVTPCPVLGTPPLFSTSNETLRRELLPPTFSVLSRTFAFCSHGETMTAAAVCTPLFLANGSCVFELLGLNRRETCAGDLSHRARARSCTSFYFAYCLPSIRTVPAQTHSCTPRQV